MLCECQAGGPQVLAGALTCPYEPWHVLGNGSPGTRMALAQMPSSHVNAASGQQACCVGRGCHYLLIALSSIGCWLSLAFGI